MTALQKGNKINNPVFCNFCISKPFKTFQKLPKTSKSKQSQFKASEEPISVKQIVMSSF